MRPVVSKLPRDHSDPSGYHTVPYVGLATETGNKVSKDI